MGRSRRGKKYASNVLGNSETALGIGGIPGTASWVGNARNRTMKAGNGAVEILERSETSGHGEASTKVPEVSEATRGRFRVAFFSTKQYERESFGRALAARRQDQGNDFIYEFTFFETRLCPQTAPLARDHDAVCIFVTDNVHEETLKWLKRYTGVRLVLLRCAGFDQCDIAFGHTEPRVRFLRVPCYNPHSVAEHAVALCLAVNRKLHKSYIRLRDSSFSLNDLAGFNLHGKTVGIIGVGQIGICAARIFLGFGCRIIAASGKKETEELRDLDVELMAVDEMLPQCNIVSLHAPLTDQTYHIIDEESLKLCKDGVLIINTGRAALINTRDVIAALKTGKVGGFGFDVYEKDTALHFEGHQRKVFQDDMFQILTNHPNVVLTEHQACLTQEALGNIADTTLDNLEAYINAATCGKKGQQLPNELEPEVAGRPG